jgi:hypothetical protein
MSPPAPFLHATGAIAERIVRNPFAGFRMRLARYRLHLVAAQPMQSQSPVGRGF